MNGNSWVGAGKSSFLALVVMVFCANGICGAQESKADSAHVHVMHVQGNVYMLVESGLNNITVEIGNQYVIVVDTGVR